MKLFRILIAVVFLTAFLSVEASADVSKLKVNPGGGCSIPISEAADTWLPGYMLELTVSHPVMVMASGPLTSTVFLGGRLAFHRWKPAGKKLLECDGSGEFEVEKNNGWRIAGELSPVAFYRLNLHGKLGVSFELAPGLFYVRQSDCYIKGYRPIGTTALNHDVYLEEDLEWTGGLSIGLSVMILERIEPTARIQYIFTSGEPTTFVMVGLNLLAH